MTKQEVRLYQAKIMSNLMRTCENHPMRTEKDKEILKNCIKHIFESELNILKQEYPDAECKLNLDEEIENKSIGGYTKSLYGKYKESKKRGLIGKNGHIGLYLDSNQYTGITDESYDIRLSAIKSLFDSIFHEIRHYEQQLSYMTKINCDTFDMLKDNILESSKLLPEFYLANYKTSFEEIDARICATEKVNEVVEQLQNIPEINDIQIEKIKKAKDMSGQDSEEDKLLMDTATRRKNKMESFQDREMFNKRYLDNEIKADPNLLKLHPVLQYKYKENGERKTAKELINEYRTFLDGGNARKDIKDLYKDSIIEALETTSLEELQEIHKCYGDGISNLYEVLLKFNQQRYEKQQESYRKYKELKGISSKDSVLNVQEENNKIKHNRRNNALELYAMGMYTEGSNILLNSVYNGIDIDYRGKVSLDTEIQKKKDIKINEMVNVYDCLENYNIFKQRSENESENIYFVLNTIRTGTLPKDFYEKFDMKIGEHYEVSQFFQLMQLVKVAQSLTLDYGENYFQEFCNIPAINTVINAMRKDNTYKSLAEKTKGMIVDETYQTETEKDKVICNKVLSKRKNPEKELEEQMYAAKINATMYRHGGMEQLTTESQAFNRMGWRLNGYAIVNQGEKIIPKVLEEHVIGKDEIESFYQDDKNLVVVCSGINYLTYERKASERGE